MWILDADYRGDIELWVMEDRVRRIRERYRPSFFLHLPDPHGHRDMLDELAARYDAEECRLRTVYGLVDGYKVHAGRDVAEAIERQSRFSAKLYNVDVRLEQRFLAEKGLTICCGEGESRFDAEFEMPFRRLEIDIDGNPTLDSDISSVRIKEDSERHLSGDEKTVLSDLFEMIGSLDPDIILLPNADYWTELILRKGRGYGLDVTLSRGRGFSRLEERSYWSYGKVNYRAGAIVLRGRVLIDSMGSYNYHEGGLMGVLMASRLTGLSANLTSRFTPGTLVSSYENYEAVRRGIAVPFRKSEPEGLRGFKELRKADRGGMTFQPEPGIYWKVHQLDFTSLYPSITVKFNLSPETIGSPDRRGFLSEVLEPLLALRVKTKNLKKTDPRYSGIDSVLKWMLVTSFGYTGYRNAKFGSIQVHERITGTAREIIMKTKEIAEGMGLEVLHGIVDCLWVKGNGIDDFKREVESATGLLTEIEAYDWLVFLPMSDGAGAYNRYYGRLSDGSLKTRGMFRNRRDTPEYIRRMQQEMLDAMIEAGDPAALLNLREEIERAFEEHRRKLRSADAKDLVINRRIGSDEYDRRCPQRSALDEYRRSGVEISPGMVIGYVVRDSKRWIVDAEWNAKEFDAAYYSGLLAKAWDEIKFTFDAIEKRSSEPSKIGSIRCFAR